PSAPSACLSPACSWESRTCWRSCASAASGRWPSC
ncbi:hypothetical protein BBBGCB_BBBGCB_05340, partial [Dysosmobacter welbionis]